MSDQRSGLSAREAHDRLQQALTELRRAEQNAVLLFAEIHERRLFRELGYSSIFQYAELALGFSRNKTYQFLRLAESLSRLPKLKSAVSSGELSWTKARELSKVATRQSEGRWIREARGCSNRELERKVVELRAGRKEKRSAQVSLLDSLNSGEKSTGRNVPDRAPDEELPVKLTLILTPEQLARLEALLEAMQKLGEKGSREELLLAALDMAVEARGDSHAGEACEDGPPVLPRGKNTSPRQVVIYKCEQCGSARVRTSRGLLPLSAAGIAAAECDARVLRPGERSRATIPPATRRAVLARDGQRCRAKGCGNTRFLEVHHVLPRAKGGSNRTENLITLCASCHLLLHEKGLAGSELNRFLTGGPARPDTAAGGAVPARPGAAVGRAASARTGAVSDC